MRLSTWMKIALDDITLAPKELSYTEDVGELNARLDCGVRDYRVASGLGVAVEYYRSGLDVFFRGSLRGEVRGRCARCLEEYAFGVDQPFVFVLAPRSAAVVDGPRLSPDDLALSYYEGEEIDLAPLVHEQLILALPTRPLCAEACRGLCPRCGTNLNTGACECPAGAPLDPRWAALHALARAK